MRPLTALLFCLLCFQPLAAQNDVAQRFAAVLTAHPDKEAVKILKSDIETGKIKVVLDKQIFLTSSDEWSQVAVGAISELISQKTLTLPGDFFSYISCHQKTLVEIIALVYNHLTKLSNDQLILLARFANPDLTGYMDSESKANLSNLITGFEEAAVKSAEMFSDFLFQVCSQQEREDVFGASGPNAENFASGSSAENFAIAAREHIRNAFEELQLQIQQ